MACAKPVHSLVRRVQTFAVECGGRIFNEGDVLPKLHAKASGRFDAGIRDKADQNIFSIPPLFELASRSVLAKPLCASVQARPRRSREDRIRRKLSAPTSGGEALTWLFRTWDGFICFHIKVTLPPAVMRHDNDLHMRRSDAGQLGACCA